MISDERAEKAQAFLLDNAKLAGELRGDRIYHEEFRKSLKAVLSSESGLKSAADREAAAYAHPKYQEHLRALKESVVRDETNKAKREAAIMLIEVWRSQSANVRGKL